MILTSLSNDCAIGEI